MPFKDIFRKCYEKFYTKNKGSISIGGKSSNIYLFSEVNPSNRISAFSTGNLCNFLSSGRDGEFLINTPPNYCFKEISGDITNNFEFFKGLARYNEVKFAYRNNEGPMNVNYSITGIVFYSNDCFECIVLLQENNEFKIFPQSKDVYKNKLRRLVENYSIRGILYKKPASKRLFTNFLSKVEETVDAPSIEYPQIIEKNEPESYIPNKEEIP